MNVFFCVSAPSSIGSTLWLDPLVERTLLKSINVITNLNNVRMELLKEGLAVDNKQARLHWLVLRQAFEQSQTHCYILDCASSLSYV